ncbi:hypothetical protein EPJ69_09490 [Brachyspira aalborgi]|uniref:Uncharacterized protein n=1 Tax=Brachyspira aalborgi TaxID=29522 RepID=A0A5C8DXZ7_9SPIR|nr:hypothetical protein [Brachyspira aalborgi]TXJ30295.1 hypothetical protein EPJ69_09490 [Brachyspira aalborgi]
MGFFDAEWFAKAIQEEDEIDKKSVKIYLKDKIDEKKFNDILIKVGLTSIEIKNSKKSEIYYKFSLNDISKNTREKHFFIGSNIKLDAEKSCIHIYGYTEFYAGNKIINKNLISDIKKNTF